MTTGTIRDPDRFLATIAAELHRRGMTHMDLWELAADRSPGTIAASWQRRHSRWRDRQAAPTIGDADLLLTVLGLHLHDLEEDDTSADDRRRGGGKPAGVYGYLTDTQLRALHRAHMNGTSIRELGRRIHTRTRYASPRSAAMGILAGFARLGLERRDRIEATVAASTVHGKASRHNPDREHIRRKRIDRGEILDRPTCAGHRTQYPGRGEPCQNRAQAGGAYCYAHDPARADERARHLEAMRSRRGHEAAA